MVAAVVLIGSLGPISTRGNDMTWWVCIDDWPFPGPVLQPASLHGYGKIPGCLAVTSPSVYQIIRGVPSA